MGEHSIYRDIAERTGGDIYIGVVGPVRTGKSTFIKRFMEALVLPNIDDGYSRDRARDEMPQSAAGKTPSYSTAERWVTQAIAHRANKVHKVVFLILIKILLNDFIELIYGTSYLLLWQFVINKIACEVLLKGVEVNHTVTREVEQDGL